MNVSKDSIELNPSDISTLKEGDRDKIFDNFLTLKNAIDEHSIVAITDAKGRIEEVNEKFCEISQYSSSELYGKDHRVINSGHHPKSFFQNLWKTISKGKVWKGDVCNKAKDGTLYWVRTTIIPIFNSDKKIIKYISIRTDISEHIKIRAELEETNQRLEFTTEKLELERKSLKNKNIALSEIVSHIDIEKEKFKSEIAGNFETVVYPILQKVMAKSSKDDLKYLILIEQSLKDILSPILGRVENKKAKLTPKELQICHMIKKGLTAKEIANLLFLSPRTIDKHRENIRKKLDLQSKKVNLSSYLLNNF